MSVTVTVNTARLSTRFKEGKQLAEKMLAEQVKNDSEPFVPKQEGTLRDSATIQQDSDGTSVVYEQIYAAYQYYGIRADGSHPVSNYTTAGTGTQWCERAKEKHERDWQKVAEKAFRKGMG